MRRHVVEPQEVGHPGKVERRGEMLEHAMGVHHPREIELAGTERRHLPVQHRDRFEVPVHHVADARVAPTHHGRTFVSRPMRIEPSEAFLDEGRPRTLVRELVPGSGVLDVTAERCVARIVEREEREPLVGPFEGVQLRQYVDGRVLQPALIVARCVEEPVVAEAVGHHVGWDLAVDSFHDEERRADVDRVGFEPPGVRHRDVGEITNPADHLELPLEVVGREDRDVVFVRSDAGNERLGAGLTVVHPLGGEQDRVARHAVGGGRADLRHHRSAGWVQPGSEPALEALAHLLGIPARALHVGHLGRALGTGLRRVNLGHRLRLRLVLSVRATCPRDRGRQAARSCRSLRIHADGRTRCSRVSTTRGKPGRPPCHNGPGSGPSRRTPRRAPERPDRCPRMPRCQCGTVSGCSCSIRLRPRTISGSRRAPKIHTRRGLIRSWAPSGIRQRPGGDHERGSPPFARRCTPRCSAGRCASGTCGTRAR